MASPDDGGFTIKPTLTVSTPPVVVMAPDSPAALMAVANAAHRQVGVGLAAALAAAIVSGAALNAAKAGVRHGEWERYLAVRGEMSKKKAERYMSIARHASLVSEAGSMAEALLLIVRARPPSTTAKPMPMLTLPSPHEEPFVVIDAAAIGPSGSGDSPPKNDSVSFLPEKPEGKAKPKPTTPGPEATTEPETKPATVQPDAKPAPTKRNEEPREFIVRIQDTFTVTKSVTAASEEQAKEDAVATYYDLFDERDSWRDELEPLEGSVAKSSIVGDDD